MKILFWFFTFLLNVLTTFGQIDDTGETALLKDLKKVDLNLNITYQKVLHRLSTNNRKILIEEQRSWINKRYGLCCKNKIEGVFGNKIKLNCLIQETLIRIKELEKLSPTN